MVHCESVLCCICTARDKHGYSLNMLVNIQLKGGYLIARPLVKAWFLVKPSKRTYGRLFLYTIGPKTRRSDIDLAPRPLTPIVWQKDGPHHLYVQLNVWIQHGMACFSGRDALVS